MSNYTEYTIFIGNCISKDFDYIFRIHNLLEEMGFKQQEDTTKYENPDHGSIVILPKDNRKEGLSKLEIYVSEEIMHLLIKELISTKIIITKILDMRYKEVPITKFLVKR
ncbi:MAG: hypothetical protein N3G19_01705 [Candidatus Pacearchaeota archaeon]|nr:hypothetical protein [Candidatus Pacearchaeota archaeon]